MVPASEALWILTLPCMGSRLSWAHPVTFLKVGTCRAGRQVPPHNRLIPHN